MATKARDKQFIYTYNGSIMSAIQSFDASPQGGGIEFTRNMRPDGKAGPAKDTGVADYSITISQELLQEEQLFPPWLRLEESRDSFTLGEIRKDGAMEFQYLECYVSSTDTSADEYGNETISVNVIARERKVLKG